MFYNQLTLQFERSTRLKARGLPATCPAIFLQIFRDKIEGNFRLILSFNLRLELRLRGYIPYGMRFCNHIFHMVCRQQEYYEDLR
jgi:hypothetical protein